MTFFRRRLTLGLLLGAATIALAASAHAAPAATVETTSEVRADQLLGAGATGANWKVQSPVRSDGFMHLYAIETPYGNFQVSGDRLLRERLAELHAVAVLEKMSKTDAFVDAAENAGLAPLRFGRDLVTEPLETTDRLVSGVAHMFDKVGDEIDNHSASRDSLVESVTGIQRAKRELAFSLKVDPYSSFPPLAEGLDGVAQMMALGDISISAAYSAVPGGAGIAVSATTTASTLSKPLRDKSSAEIAAGVRAQLASLGVSEDKIKPFLANVSYSPADLLAIAEALTSLQAKNSSAFIERAAVADNVDVAKFQRYRAELMARQSARLGTLTSFETVSGFAVNRDGKGDFVAVFPFDEVVWTESASRSFAQLSAEINKLKPGGKPVLATTARVSETAQERLKALGWQLVRLPAS
jgi:hypothetical protein